VRKNSLRILTVALLIALTWPVQISAANPNEIQLKIESIDTPTAQVQGSNGERGAALARLADGRLLLGGGATGLNLYLYDLTNRTQTLIGRAGSSSERIDDSRFAITDIAVMRESANTLDLVISYPRYDRTKECVSVVLYSYSANIGIKPSLKRGKLWFNSKPCVPISAVQHASGRIATIDKKSVYLTVGDLGYTEIGNRDKRADLGSVFKISASKVEKISSGHRNAQGILRIGKDLYVSEHGPRGGDELNLIETGGDYGWPFVTYGEPYSSGDYVRPTNTGSHEGYIKPLYNWVPSVAPTELIQLPADKSWGPWSSYIVMGTLKDQVLIFIEMLDRRQVGKVVKVNVNERVRDLDLSISGSIIATTDSGKLLVINLAS
jgi:glucose/arabinose dehydrogenase